jgi:hypothetical protein
MQKSCETRNAVVGPTRLLQVFAGSLAWSGRPPIVPLLAQPLVQREDYYLICSLSA